MHTRIFFIPTGVEGCPTTIKTIWNSAETRANNNGFQNLETRFVFKIFVKPLFLKLNLETRFVFKIFIKRSFLKPRKSDKNFLFFTKKLTHLYKYLLSKTNIKQTWGLHHACAAERLQKHTHNAILASEIKKSSKVISEVKKQKKSEERSDFCFNNKNVLTTKIKRFVHASLSFFFHFKHSFIKNLFYFFRKKWPKEVKTPVSSV